MKLSETDLRHRFKGKKVAVIGDIVADQFLHGTISRVSREAPVFILKHNETETRPGAAANAAANVAALGGWPILVGTIGSDQTADELWSSLEAIGVDCGHIIRDNENKTTRKLRVLAGQPYGAKQQVIRIDYESDGQLSENLRKRVIESAVSATADADAVVISDYGYGIAARDLINSVREISKKRSTRIIADSRSGLANFSRFSSATPNQEEAEAILGGPFRSDGAERLRSLVDLDSIVVTLGGKGMVLAEKGRPVVEIPAVGSDQPVDVTGAGDTVIAAYALGLASGMSAFEAATIANHAGGIVVMKRGTAVATIEELEHSIAAFPEADANAATNEP